MSESLRERSGVDDIIDALLQVPGAADSDARDGWVDEVGRRLRRRFDATRFADPRPDSQALVSACLSCSGGLRTLALVVHRSETNEASRRVVELAERITGTDLLSAPDRKLIENQLAEIPIPAMAAAFGDLVQANDLRSIESWRDIPAVIRALEALPLPDDGVPQLLVFADRLAHTVTGFLSTRLRSWIDLVSGGLGVDEAALAELRRASQHAVTSARLPIVPPPQRTGSTDEALPPRRPRRSDETGLVWGGVPLRNRNFSGRVALLDRLGEALRTGSTASVLPQTLRGMGGVGKTQLVIEYVYRHIDEYDVIWWIPSEQASSVLSSLSQLAARLGLPISTDDRMQTARTVLDALASTDLAWLLVYDNADEPSALRQFVPSTGGHVVITTRNPDWSELGKPIEVDVFERHESIELLQRRSHGQDGVPRITVAEADLLADKLGDLPLALEQAVAWFLATAMPIDEYIQLLDSHVKEILSEGKPAAYPGTVAAFVTFAVEQLRENSPSAAQLFELFAFLGGEPVSVSMLRQGAKTSLTEPLRATLGASIPTSRTVRELSRYGLAKVDTGQQVQVHRLVQRVLRDGLSPDRAAQALRNTRLLLTAASPGDPDDNSGATLDHLGPHIDPADLIHASDAEARQVVLDYSRYLYVTGDYEGSLRMATRAATVWTVDLTDPSQLGPDGEQTLLARGQESNALRVLGFSNEAAVIAADTYERFLHSPSFGAEHEYTLIHANQVGADLRISGAYADALEFDRDSLTRHERVFEPDNSYTLRAKANLAIDHRMVGDFALAYVLDEQIAGRWQDVKASDPRALAAYMNLARSCYGLGAYRLGLEILQRWQPQLQANLGSGNSQVLLAGRTHAILLRKLGRVDEALAVIEENEARLNKRFPAHHEFVVAATVSRANVLRELGRLDEAADAMTHALRRYHDSFGRDHPLTLMVQVNEAIIRRARGESALAQSLDEQSYARLTEVLGSSHPYTICAGGGLASDRALAGEHEAALRLSSRMLELAVAKDGQAHPARDEALHPYLLMRQVNLSHDLRSTGDGARADVAFAEALAGLRIALGATHPEVVAVERGARTESDIEPPPT